MLTAATFLRVREGLLPNGISRLIGKVKPITPCGPSAIESFGWLPPDTDSPEELYRTAGDWVVAKAAQEKKSVPAAEVSKRVEALAEKVERDTGRKPGRKARAEIRGHVILEMLPTLIPKLSTAVVMINRKTGLMIIGAKRASLVDFVTRQISDIDFVSNDIDGVRTLSNVRTAHGVSSCMAGWVRDGFPGGLAVGGHCRLESGGGSHSETVLYRYIDSVTSHEDVIARMDAGMVPTEVSLLGEAFSAVLMDDLTMKSIRLDEGRLLGASEQDEHFAGTAIIYAETLKSCIEQVVEAAGGLEDAQ